MPCATTRIRMCAKEFRLGQVEHAKDASTSAKPRMIFALGLSVAAPLISRLPTGIKHAPRLPVARAPTTELLPIQRGPCPHTRELSDPTRISHCAGVVYTRSPAPSSFHSQDMVAPWASVRLNAHSHSDSNSQPLHIRRCLRRIRPQQKAVARLERLHSWHTRPGMNDLGTWAEL